jgi:hypothetical protein
MNNLYNIGNGIIIIIIIKTTAFSVTYSQKTSRARNSKNDKNVNIMLKVKCCSSVKTVQF